MQKRNATAAIIGAGDYIGSAIAKRFAREGYTVFAGRRTADKLETLKKEIEAEGGRCEARGMDARKEDSITQFLNEADAHAPLEVCIFNPGANVNFPLLETTERVFRKVWEMVPHRPRSRAADAAAWQRYDPVHRRDRIAAGRQRLCGLRLRQIRPACCGAKHGA
jgi:NAD(P)-dependent dehydrogenase (short-subunit alcohol dehydrogenase family)